MTAIVQMATVCSFCERDAVSAWRRVLFCSWHLTLFYLSLDGEWHD